MILITRPADGFNVFAADGATSASKTEGFRLNDLFPHPWLPGDAYHIPFFLP